MKLQWRSKSKEWLYNQVCNTYGMDFKIYSKCWCKNMEGKATWKTYA